MHTVFNIAVFSEDSHSDEQKKNPNTIYTYMYLHICIDLYAVSGDIGVLYAVNCKTTTLCTHTYN